MIPCSIGVSSRSGEFELITVKIDGSALQGRVVDPAGDAHHLDAVAVALPAEAVAVECLSVSVRTSKAASRWRTEAWMSIGSTG